MAQSAGSTRPVSTKTFAEENGDCLVRLDCLRIACRYLESRISGGEKVSASMPPIAVAESFFNYVLYGPSGKPDVDSEK